MENAAILLTILVSVVLMLKLIENRWNRRRTVPNTKEPLEKPLLWWNTTDYLSLRDLLNGGIAIFGRSGSGKTSSSGKKLAQAIIGSGNLKSAGLIIVAKPEDLAMWQAWFAAAGRSQDLIVFGPGCDRRFNFLAYVLASGGQIRDVVRCIITIAETLRNSDTKGGENADFWERETERLLFVAVMIVWLATDKVSAPDIQRFITAAAMSPQQLAVPEWQAGYHNQCLKAAFEKQKTAIEKHDFEQAMDYWLSEFPNMADKTRSSILTGVMGILHTFNTGVVRELVSTTTNCSPDDMLAGKFVLVDMCPAEWGDSGALVAAGWKFLTQRRALRRAAKPEDNIVVIWADEAQQVVTTYDAHYLAQCRSHLACLVYLTQSLHSYYSTLKGQTGRHQADALLTNFHHKILHALGDAQTAEWASGLIGKSLQTFVGGSLAPVEDLWEEMMGRQKVTSSTNEHYESILQTNAFMNGLRTGGPSAGYVCDGIVVRSGEPFSNGANWLWVEFSQR